MSPKLFNILLVITPLVLYYGYIDPVYNGSVGFVWTPESSIRALQSQNVQYTNTLNQIEAIEAEVTKLNKDYEGVNADLKTKVTTLLPDTLDPIKLRNEVVSIANKSGIALAGLQIIPDGKSQNKEFKSYIISFSFRSRYAGTKKLIESYEKSMRLYTLDSISIKRVEKKAAEATPGQIDDPDMLSTTVSFRVNSLK